MRPLYRLVLILAALFSAPSFSATLCGSNIAYFGTTPGNSACSTEEICSLYSSHYGITLSYVGNQCSNGQGFNKNISTRTCVVNDQTAYVNGPGSSGTGCDVNPCEGAYSVGELGNPECPPPPPPPGVCDGYPEGWEPMPFTVGGETTMHCTFIHDENDQEQCDYPQGTVTWQGETTTVCLDDKLECESNNGTWGEWNGNAICIPDDYDDDLPTCDISSVQTYEDEEGGGGFACASPYEELDDDTPNPDRDPPDQDGDGIPDDIDPDRDGDGIPNESDTDSDNDGIPDDSDPEPFCPDGQVCEESEESEVSGGGECKVPPSCKGDAIQCAILYQTWKGRCDALEDEDDFDELTEEQVSSSGYVTGNDPSQLDQGDTSLQTILQGVYNQTGGTASCPADQQILVAGLTLNVPYAAFCDFSMLIRPVVLFFFGLAAFRIVMRAF